MGLSRREFMKAGVLGGASLILPLQPILVAAARRRLPESKLPAPFAVPLSIPPVLPPLTSEGTTDFYEITMREAEAEILPGRSTTIFGYNGITPGPTLSVRRGRTVVVRQINALPQRHPTLRYECTTSVHLHGNATPPQYDGWAEDLSAPGFFKDYIYPNDQNERTMWYHDHAVHHTAENTYMGLAGLYITDEGRNIPLPSGRYDVPLVVQDKIFDTDGQFLFDDDGQKELMGDVILVNGRPWPVLQVERRKYLFRILNASTSRAYRLALSTGEPFTFVSGDGGLMPAPQQDKTFRIGVAERYGVVIDFAKYPIGQQVVLRNLELKNNEEFPSTRQVMRFDVVSEAADLTRNEVPAVLKPGGGQDDPMALQPSQARRTRDWRFERRRGQWAINGLFWDPRRMDAAPGLNDVEIWRFDNHSGGWFHPVHVHLIDFKILDRNGRPPFPYERGPKDTVYVGEGEVVRLIGKFGPHAGKYMMHCHNVVHEDHEMMTNFEVGKGGPDPVTAAPPRPVSELPGRPL
ncbi:multicopper oxidase domain-containing protein [Pseudonocardia bannensis]|uniref:Multicopper oxidase domain-containing protein n=2 Tax=Pseudonocardia bannensis TaxID=630973 RepID=A0A848DKD3_9PSEU|nr:multicopper oxidase domain-containing protein [Pseudonocardia bannensis]